jgi:hypothetical protein
MNFHNREDLKSRMSWLIGIRMLRNRILQNSMTDGWAAAKMKKDWWIRNRNSHSFSNFELKNYENNQGLLIKSTGFRMWCLSKACLPNKTLAKSFVAGMWNCKYSLFLNVIWFIFKPISTAEFKYRGNEMEMRNMGEFWRQPRHISKYYTVICQYELR